MNEQSADASQDHNGPRRLATISWHSVGVWVGLLLLVIVGACISESFFSAANLFNILRQASMIAIIALGMTFVIISGGIDLSVGSIVALVSVLVAGTINRYGIAMGLALGLGAGMAAGAINGAGVVYFKMPPFIMTLAGMTIYRGLAFIYSGGKPITVAERFAGSFNVIGGGYLGPAPYPVVIMFILFALGYVVLRHTPIGTYVFAIGGNEDAARLSGVNIALTKVFVYTVSGLCSAFSAIILTSRVTVGEPIAGVMYELEAIAAAVIGGASLAGGRGGVGGALAGSLILFILLNLFNMKNVPSYYQDVFKGIIIVLAVLIQYKRR